MSLTFKSKSCFHFAVVAGLLAACTAPVFAAWVSIGSGNSNRMAAPSFGDLIVADKGCSGVYGSTNGGATWNKLGGTAGNNVTNGGTNLFFDPINPNTFWEAGMYGGASGSCSGWGPGVFKSSDGGTTIIAVAGFNHNDGLGIDFSDPQRLTQIAGGHEDPGVIYKSADGISSYNLKPKFPTGTTAAGACYVIDAKTYLVGCTTYGSGNAGIYRTADGGETWTRVATQATGITGSGAGFIRLTTTGTLFATPAQSGSLLKGSRDGATWTTVNVSGYSSGTPGELPGGIVAVAGNSAILISSNEGTSWQSIAAGNPGKTGVFYNRTRGALYCYQAGGGIWRFDTVITANPDIYALTSSPVAIINDKANSVTFTVHAATGTGTISGVTIDLSAAGGGASVAMTAGTGDLYTATFNVPASLSAGIKQLTATATTSGSASASITGAISVVAAPTGSRVKYLYADTSAVQATFGWYGNGAGNGTAATGCAATEATSGGSEGAKCLDFQFAINSWWAGFNLSWNSYAYTAPGNIYDSICFDFKTTNNVRFSLNLALPGDTSTVNAELLFSGSGGWQHASLPLSYFTSWGYSVDSIVGFAVTMKGQDGYNPSSGHLYLDNIYVIGGGTVGIADRHGFNTRQVGSLIGNLPSSILKAYDIRGRLVTIKRQLQNYSHISGLYLVKNSSGLVVHVRQ